jgi:hypothetical protein
LRFLYSPKLWPMAIFSPWSFVFSGVSCCLLSVLDCRTIFVSFRGFACGWFQFKSHNQKLCTFNSLEFCVYFGWLEKQNVVNFENSASIGFGDMRYSEFWFVGKNRPMHYVFDTQNLRKFSKLESKTGPVIKLKPRTLHGIQKFLLLRQKLQAFVSTRVIFTANLVVSSYTREEVS